jgi:hypothetical protein
MEDLLRTFYNEIKSKTRVGAYKELLLVIEHEIDKFTPVTEEKPYLKGDVKVKIHIKYNPKFGDNKICECGHTYYRHFDTYAKMYPCGCKYCKCETFVEKSV